MTAAFEYGAVEGVPYGLAACRLNGIQKHIERISPRAVWVRSIASVAMPVCLEFAFYNGKGYETLNTKAVGVSFETTKLGAGIWRIEIDDAAYDRAVRNALELYAETARLRADGIPGCRIGYPYEKDELFFETVQQQLRDFAARAGSLSETAAEIGICLSSAAAYRLFIECGDADLEASYARAAGLPADFFGTYRIERLYIGDPACRHRAPCGEIRGRILERANASGLKLTFVNAEPVANSEVILNDRSSIPRGCVPVLGPLLNKYSRDPRSVFVHNGSKPSEHALSDAAYRTFLKEIGIERYAYESCPSMPDPAGKHNTLFTPFYTASASAYCTLNAACETGDRGQQRAVRTCSGYCERNAFLYPKHLDMIGIGNRLLGFDARWRQRLSAFDRIALNFPVWEVES